METLLAKVKISHSRRVFCLKKEEKKKISLKDMNNGFDIYTNNNEVKKIEKILIFIHLCMFNLLNIKI